MTITPQPGDVWERDGERRKVVAARVIMEYRVSGENRTRLQGADFWMQWQSGATLIERGGKAVPHD